MKRTQEGKTFELINRILDSLQSKSGVDFVFTMKLLDNTEQCVTRLWRQLVQELGEDLTRELVVMVASKPPAGAPFRVFKSLDEVAALAERPRVVIGCSHYTKFDQVYSLVDKLDTGAAAPGASKEGLGCFAGMGRGSVRIHHDELHKYMGCRVEVPDRGKCDLRTKIADVATRAETVLDRVHGYTATPGPIFDPSVAHKDSAKWAVEVVGDKKEQNVDSQNAESRARAAAAERRTHEFWDNVALAPLDKSKLKEEEYAGCDDVQFFEASEESEELKPLDFTARTIQHHAADLFRQGTRVFLPAQAKMESHREMRHLVHSVCRDAVVVTLNSDEKTATYYDGDGRRKVIDLTATEQGFHGLELSQKIAEVVQWEQLERRPLVVTGYFCLGMGQTFLGTGTG